MSIGGNAIPQENAWATLVGTVRTDAGDLLHFPHPHIPSFYLTEASRLMVRGERFRQHSLRATKLDSQTGNIGITTLRTAVDAIGNLTMAVFMALGAVEAAANECISNLPDSATLEVERRGVTVVLSKDNMERRLSLEEKIDLVAPLTTGRPTIKGTVAWEALKRLAKLRNEVVHVKERGYSFDPDDPSIFGKIVLGRTVSCVDDAVYVFEGAFPAAIMPLAREELGLPPGTDDQQKP